MQKKTIIQLLRLAVVVLFFPTLLVRCANIMSSPLGGPKDTLPPVIMTMMPENFTKGMKDRTKIYIEFDEFVQLKDQQKEFFTSPAMKRKPTLSIRGRGVVVQLRDTMLPNTTYALNFGSAIRDNNEGNPLYSMRYVFSTGSEIDSMICSGYTADGYKADSVPKSYVYFFIADSVENVPQYDSTMFKYKPAVIGRAENNGIFIAQNLKPVPYRVYAMQDKNDNQTYEPSVDQVGFIEGAYNPAELPEFAIWYDSVRHYVTADPQLYFRMFTDGTFRRQMLPQSGRPRQHKAMLYFNAPNPVIEELRFDSIPSDRVIIEPLTKGRDTVALWFNVAPAELPDTIKGSITYLKHDTTNTLRPVTEQLKLAWRLIETKEQQKEREKREKEQRKAEAAGEEYAPPKEKSPFLFKLSTSGDINPEKHLIGEFEYPLVKIDSAAMLLTRMLENNLVEDVAMRFVRDTANLHLWRIEAPWRAAGQYTLTIPQGALTDVTGFSNDSIVGKYMVMDPEKFAVVKITVTPKSDSTKYIIQLLGSNGSLQQERRDIEGGVVQFNYVPVGEVKFRVIEDFNGNGKWDTGSLVERRQPERTEVYTNPEGKDLFTTKANWEFEFEMNMNELFAPVTMESLSEMLEERERQRLIRLEEQRRKEGSAKKPDANTKNQGGSFGGTSSGMGSVGGNMFNTNNTR